MSTDQILETILSNTYTKTDCYQRLLMLQDILERRSYGGDKEAHAPKTHDETSEEAADAIRAWGKAVMDELGSGMRERLQELRQRIAVLPELMLYMPVRPSAAHTVELGKWCRTHVHPQGLIDLRVDPASTGGCFLVWKDMFYDFSLPYFMDKHRAALADLITRYQRAYEK